MKNLNIAFCERCIAAFLALMLSSAIVMAQGASGGFADVSGTTTGGGNGTAVTVKTFNELKTQCASSSALVITVEGTITGSGSIEIASNKTIQGKGGTSKIQGFTLAVKNSSNVIIRDLKVTGGVDGIAVNNSHHVWIDHCEIWDCSDGLCDITNASSYCTVSWCKFYYVNQTDHRLACLIGNGGGTKPGDWGKNKVTYHHNWFGTKVDQRQPRLMYGQGHAYNNYYTCTGNSYCIGVGSYGMALIENNYFKGVNSPHEFMYDIFCHITARGNTYDNCTGNKQTGLGGTRKETGQDFDVVPFTTAPYSYTMDAVANIPAIVMSGAGPRSSVVNVPVTGVTVAPTTVSIGKGATSQLTVAVAPTNATNKAVTWTSSNTAVATVSSTGLVTGVAAGTATITVKTTDGSKTATCAVTVTETTVAVTVVTVSPASSSVIKGATTQLTATVAPTNATNKAVTWTSSNTAVATVSSTGLVTGVAAGTATITAKTTDGSKTATCAITVTNTNTTITIEENATGFCSFEGTIDRDNVGFTGPGFANTNNAIDAGITYSVSVPSAGAYTLAWRHANGTTAARTAKVLVDGVAVVASLNFPVSGAWTTWINTSTSINLAAGTHKIRLQANLATGLPNIDNMSITGNSPTPVACVGLKSASLIEPNSNNATFDKIVLFPNPVVNDVINISGNLFASSSMKISIYNEMGILIDSRNMGVLDKGNFKVSIPAETIKPGIYIVKIQMDASIETISFIKK